MAFKKLKKMMGLEEEKDYDSDDVYYSENSLQIIVDNFYKQNCGMFVGAYAMTNFKMDRFILNSCFVVYISHYCWIWPIGQASFPWPLLLLSGENTSAIPAKITSRRIAYSSTAGKSYVCDTQPAQKRKSDMKGERHNVQ